MTYDGRNLITEFPFGDITGDEEGFLKDTVEMMLDGASPLEAMLTIYVTFLSGGDTVVALGTLASEASSLIDTFEEENSPVPLPQRLEEEMGNRREALRDEATRAVEDSPEWDFGLMLQSLAEYDFLISRSLTAAAMGQEDARIVSIIDQASGVLGE